MINHHVSLLKNNVFKSLCYLSQRRPTGRNLEWNVYKISEITQFCTQLMQHFNVIKLVTITHAHDIPTNALWTLSKCNFFFGGGGICHVRLRHYLMNGHETHNYYYFQITRNVIFVCGYDICCNALYFKSPRPLHELGP
jgi:hypothetical protein